MRVKQVIVMRKDLGMRKGKMIAQGAHASLKVFFDLMFKPIPFLRFFCLFMTKPMYKWKTSAFVKITVSVNSEKELLDIYDRAESLGLPVALIKDAGKTEFKGVPTYTCLAIGPDNPEDIDVVTGKLPLL